MSEHRTFVVVGGGLAGAKAVVTLRAEGFTGRLVLVAAEPELPYERPPLSKGYLLGKDQRESTFVQGRTWYDEHDIDLLLGRPAVSLDPAGHVVVLAGDEEIAYERLLIATGSRPRRLEIAGADLAGVHTLRNLPDSDALKAALARGGRWVVIGAGWIGLEVASAARTHGVEVTVVESAGLPLQRVLGDRIAASFADLHRDHGVDLRLGAGVAGFGGTGTVQSVTLGSGEELAADLVVVGVGVAPAVELAASGGLGVENGVTVDAALRSSDPDVFAAGDVASAYHPVYGRHLRTEHWANALHGGPAAARSMLGQGTTYDRLPYFYTDQYDLGMEYVGWTDRVDDVVVRGDLAGLDYQAFWLADDVVQAAMHVNRWDAGADALKAVVGLRRPVDRDRLADDAVPLTDL